MLYLLDANVLITAHDQYYPLDAVPEFWEWLLYMADSKSVKMPLETFEEVTVGHEDGLVEWMKADGLSERLLLDEEVDPMMVRRVLEEGYAPDLSDTEVEQVGRDPFLIAYAWKDARQRCVVSVEASKPSKQRANRRVPDVCASLGVSCCDSFVMMRQLGFTTAWKTNGKVAPPLSVVRAQAS